MKRAANVVVAAAAFSLKRRKTDELRHECSRLGLDTSGLKADLIKRLEVYQNHHPEAVISLLAPKPYPTKDSLYTRKQHLGTPQPEKEIEVRVRLKIKDLLDINVPDHSFKIKFSMEVSWEVPENELSLYDSDLPDDHHDYSDGLPAPLTHRSTSFLSSSSGEIPYSRTAWESETQFPPTLKPRGSLLLRWTPRLVFSNCIELEKDFEFYEEFEIDEVSKRKFVDMGRRPVIVYRIRAVGRFQERFELASFPLDAQDLQVDVIAKRGASQIKLIKNRNEMKYRSVVPVENFMINEEYELSKAIVAIESQTTASESSIRGRVYSKLTFSMKAMRRPSYYTWSIVVPMFLYVILAFPAVLLPISDLNGRLSVVMTILVASVTHSNQVLSGSIPKMPYLSLLDKHVALCNFMLLLITLESTLAYLVSKFIFDGDVDGGGAMSDTDKDQLKLLDRFEDWLTLIVLVMWIGGHLLYVSYWTSFTAGWAANSKTELEKEGAVDYRDAEIQAELTEGMIDDTAAMPSKTERERSV